MESTSTFDKNNNEIFVDDVVIYSDPVTNVVDGVGIVRKVSNGVFNINNVNLKDVSSLNEAGSLERHGPSN